MKGLPFIFIVFCFSSVTFAQTTAVQKGAEPRVLNFVSFASSQDAVMSEELTSLTPARFRSHPEFGKLPYNTQCGNCIELLNKRTDSSRYFIKSGSNGKTFYVQQGYSALHYKDGNNNLVSIDPRLKPNPAKANTFYAPDQQMPTGLDLNTGASSIKLGAFELAFNFNPKIYHADQNTEISLYGNINLANTTVGEDGALTKNAWPGIDRTMEFSRGSVKTNVIFNAVPALPSNSGWMAFEDEVTIPAGYSIIKDSVAGNFSTAEGYWPGNLKLVNELSGAELARWFSPVILDGNGNPASASNTAYQLKKTGSVYFIRTMVKVEWMVNPATVYPVTIDPLVSGTNTWSAGNLGFTAYLAGNGFCGNSAAFCTGGPLNVTFPGGAAITNVVWSSQYIATAGHQMQNGGFRMVGPCGENPVSTNGWFSCASIASGTCSGSNIAAPALATCYVPACTPTIVPFFMKSIDCAYGSPACSVLNYYTVNNSWIVTVEGQTVGQPSPPVSSEGTTFCNGMCTTITATGNYGVPPYAYTWNPGGATGNPLVVCPPINTTTTYSCVITDLCGLTATNQVAITTTTATLLTPTFSLSMNPAGGTPCPVTVTACSDLPSNYGGGSENYVWNFIGGNVISGGALSGSAMGPSYGGAGSNTLCAGGPAYTIVYNATGTYTLGVNIIKNANCGFYNTTINVTCAVPLSIELRDYYLNYNGESCEINWATSSEKNTDYFLIEKSSDDYNYSLLAKLPAARNSADVKKYSILDLNPNKDGLTYYRLKLFENETKEPKVSLVKVLNTKEEKIQIRIQPNPASDNLEIYLPESFLKKSVVLQVFDNTGKRVLIFPVTKTSPESAYNLNLETLMSGVYTLRIIDDSGNSAKANFIKN